MSSKWQQHHLEMFPFGGQGSGKVPSGNTLGSLLVVIIQVQHLLSAALAYVNNMKLPYTELEHLFIKVLKSAAGVQAMKSFP